MRIALVLLLSLAGCQALPPTGPMPPYPASYSEVRPLGGGAYQVAGFGSTVTWSSPEVKAQLNRSLSQDAGQYCAKSGKQAVPLSSTSSGSAMETYATVQIQFRCE